MLFLAHTLSDDHSASEMNKENTLGNILKLTGYYPASELGIVGIASSKLRGNVC